MLCIVGVCEFHKQVLDLALDLWCWLQRVVLLEVKAHNVDTVHRHFAVDELNSHLVLALAVIVIVVVLRLQATKQRLHLAVELLLVACLFVVLLRLFLLIDVANLCVTNFGCLSWSSFL